MLVKVCTTTANYSHSHCRRRRRKKKSKCACEQITGQTLRGPSLDLSAPAQTLLFPGWGVTCSGPALHINAAHFLVKNICTEHLIIRHYTWTYPYCTLQLKEKEDMQWINIIIPLFRLIPLVWTALLALITTWTTCFLPLACCVLYLSFTVKNVGIKTSLVSCEGNWFAGLLHYIAECIMFLKAGFAVASENTNQALSEGVEAVHFSNFHPLLPAHESFIFITVECRSD